MSEYERQFYLLLMESCDDPVGSHGLSGLFCDVIAKIFGKDRRNTLCFPSACNLCRGVLDLGIPELCGKPLVDVIDLELEAVGEAISAAYLGNQRKADEVF